MIFGMSKKGRANGVQRRHKTEAQLGQVSLTLGGYPDAVGNSGRTDQCTCRRIEVQIHTLRIAVHCRSAGTIIDQLFP